MNSFPVAWPPEVFIARHKILKKSLINDTNINPNQCKIQRHKNAIEYSTNQWLRQYDEQQMTDKKNKKTSYPCKKMKISKKGTKK